MNLAESITLVPYLHGKLAFAQHVRDLCLQTRFDCIAVDLPCCLQEHLFDAVHDLPHISAVVAHDTSGPVYYAPADPCDASIEAIRQSRQNHVPCFCIGSPFLCAPRHCRLAARRICHGKLGFDAYASMCLRVLSAPATSDENGDAETNSLCDATPGNVRAVHGSQTPGACARV